MTFDDYEDLLKFVLTECGEMKFYTSVIKHENGWSEPTVITLSINEGFDMERIYYAYVLLLEQFNINIRALILTAIHITDIPEGFLEKMELNKISLYDNQIRKLPRLNDSVQEVFFDEIEANFQYCGSGYDIVDMEDDEKITYKIGGIVQRDSLLLQMQQRRSTVYDDWELYELDKDDYFIYDDQLLQIYDMYELDKILSVVTQLFSKEKSKNIYNALKKNVYIKD